MRGRRSWFTDAADDPTTILGSVLYVTTRWFLKKERTSSIAFFVDRVAEDAKLEPKLHHKEICQAPQPKTANTRSTKAN